MPVINTTPSKILSSCDAQAGAIFSVSFSGCDMILTNESTLLGISNIEYEFVIATTTVDTVNTTLADYIWHPASLYANQTLRITQTVTSGVGTFSTTQDVNVPALSACYFEFQSNLPGSSSIFDPEVTTTGDNPYWRLPDDIVRQAASLSVAGSAGGFTGTTQSIRFAPRGPFSDITTFQAPSDSLVNTLNISKLISLSGAFRISGNPGLNTIIFPTSSSAVTEIDASNCGLTGTLNVSPLSNFSGAFFVQNNTSLTGLAFSATSGAFSFFRFENCDITGVLDLSMLTGIGGQFRGQGNSSLTNVTFGTSSTTFSNLYLFNCDLTGTQDISGLTGLAGSVQFENNPNLTGITFPSSSGAISFLSAQDCDLTGTVDLSPLSNLRGLVFLHRNPNLTDVTLPVTANVFSFFHFYNCGITGTFDLSNLSGLGGNIDGRNNTSMTGVTFPTSSTVVTNLRLDFSNLTGTLSLVGLTGLGGSFNVTSNSNLTGVTFPTTAQTFSSISMSSCDLGVVDITGLTLSSAIAFQMQDNAMTAAEVNEMLVDLDATAPGSGTGAISLGGTNAAPDGTSGGFDGVTAKNNLIAAGYTVSTS